MAMAAYAPTPAVRYIRRERLSWGLRYSLYARARKGCNATLTAFAALLQAGDPASREIVNAHRTVS